MTVKDAVGQFLKGLVEIEVQKLLPFVAHLIPGVPGKMLEEVLSRPDVQRQIAAWEAQGVEFVVVELGRSIHWLADLVQSHVKGTIGKAVHDALAAAPSAPISLSADQVRALAILAAAGKVDAVLDQAVADLLPPDPAAPGLGHSRTP